MVNISDERFERMGMRMRAILGSEVERLVEKDKGYGRSWMKRGGVGAFMMLARKWDRLEQRLCQLGLTPGVAGVASIRWDIFAHLLLDKREEGLIDDMRDLRCYLLLVEEEMMERGILPDVVDGLLHTDDNTGMEHPFGFDAEQEGE